jgi:hypothetical protein
MALPHVLVAVHRVEELPIPDFRPLPWRERSLVAVQKNALCAVVPLGRAE